MEGNFKGFTKYIYIRNTVWNDDIWTCIFKEVESNIVIASYNDDTNDNISCNSCARFSCPDNIGSRNEGRLLRMVCNTNQWLDWV